ncbi:MAG: N-acetylmuramoyl-L-alanine amidase family protein [Clostridium sp.]|uniref:N-acetylmuramoyl-L-alanine amidase family protein n=1 Tax=Clostridium sp. TaxID=1506 RepID=UPI0025B7DDCC|nr:N-acetylmuramoyl-L-alanine amidase family protein [Clostridium sp.]MCE5221763.1 N-acetylmuramoyl-L-alanine amidase family protein [Clostridium sp.]
MFKRANKITALLVAAASVMSVVPAMASDRLGTKDGTVENAVAYKDGKYVYQGYRTDDDDAAIYYNAGDKDKLLEDVEDANLGGNANYSLAYEDKYATAEDGSDEYLIDLSSGDVVDDDTAEDKADSAETKLKSALKKTDRYDDSIVINAGDVTQIQSGAKFGDVWYKYEIAPSAHQDNSIGSLTGPGTLIGFTNQTGKYIDASNLANIYAYSTAKGKMVKVEEYNDYNSDTKLEAELVSLDVLTQDADYIYALATVNVNDSANTTLATGTTSSSVTLGTAGITTGTTTKHYYVQKISKAQGDKKDDAYLPKTVASYEVNVGEILDSDDATDAADVLVGATNTTYAVVGSQLLAIHNDATATASGNVKVTSINLKKDKVEYKVASAPTGKVDVYLAEKDDADDVDIDNVKAVDTDVDGNVWAVADGKIYEFKNNEFTKVYSVDSSLDALSIYDENSLITWEVDGDIYTTVNEGKAQTETEAAPVAPAKVGWDQLADGTWNFYDATGTKVANNWVNVGGAWYYLKADGVMATGWLNSNGTWYFLKASGAMATGWLNDNGTWYFLNASGAMLANTTVDGYVLGASGAWVK